MTDDSDGDDARVRDTPPSAATSSRHQVHDSARALLDASNAVAWAVDLEYRLIDGNVAFHAACAAILGRPIATGESVLTFPVDRSVHRAWQAHFAAAFDGVDGEFVGELPTPDGLALVELITTPLRDAHGTIVGCAAVCRELTLGTPAERELRARQGLDLALFAKHPQPMWIYDDESLQILAVNAAAIAHYGWSEAEFLSMTELDLRPAREVPALLDQIARDPVPRPPLRGVWEHTHRDGRTIAVQVYESSVTFRGRPARVVSVHDLGDEQRLAHESLERTGRVHEAAHALPIGVLAVASDGVVQWANPAAHRLVGWSLTGYAMDDVLRHAHPADAFAARAHWRAYVSGSAALDLPYDLRFVHPDGDVIWASMRAAGLPASPGTSAGHVVTLADRSSVAEAREADAAARQRADQRRHLESLGTLAAGLAHEFRNVLSVIGGHAELLQITSPDHAEFATSVRELIDATARGRDLVNATLSLGRGDAPDRRAWTEALPHLRAATSMAATSVGTVPLEVDLPSTLGATALTATEWLQLLLNVVQNAAHAMGSTQRAPVRLVAAPFVFVDGVDVSTGRLAAGQYVGVSVRDAGSGIAPDDLPRLFDPFFSTRRGAGGSGLGLSVVAGLLRGIGGGVDVQSVENVGTTMQLYVPARFDVTATDAISDARLRVLIVSSNLARKRALESTLRESGFATEVSASASAAAARVRGAAPRIDAVFVEYDLGARTGVELAEELHAAAPSVPVILGTTPGMQLADTALEERGVALRVADMETESALVRSIRRAVERAGG
ncbi:MAG: ATP-binding protein [Gemmatimonadaceae bacterium]|jgi:PAS domain S-box-containing protein|nr:ATP-binding protein [Gemmatimonadaceae bacterium]